MVLAQHKLSCSTRGMHAGWVGGKMPTAKRSKYRPVLPCFLILPFLRTVLGNLHATLVSTNKIRDWVSAAVKHYTAWHGTAQHTTAEQSRAQHSTAQPSLPEHDDVLSTPTHLIIVQVPAETSRSVILQAPICTSAWHDARQ